MVSHPFPDSARAVIIGGGVVGCSVAYHLTKLGWRDVVRVEQGGVTPGNTRHAPRLGGQMRPNRTMTARSRHRIQLYAGLGKGAAVATGSKQFGTGNGPPQ